LRQAAAAGTISLVAAACVIGASALAVKVAYQYGEAPKDLATVRFAIAGALALATLLSRSDRRRQRLSLRALTLQAAAGIALFVGARGELEGLARLPAAILILLIFVAPIWVTLIEWLVWRRRPDMSEAIAAAAVIAGIFVMASSGRSALNAVGIAAGLAASLGFASFLVLMKTTERVSDLGSGTCVALIAAGLVGTLFHPTALADLAHVSRVPYVVSVGVAVWLWALLIVVGLTRTTAITAATISAVEPVFVAILAFLVLGERLSARQIVGGAIVIAGVVYGSRASAVAQAATTKSHVRA
jgi:drug/metabolite transporter (DMT)-like permease